MRRIIERVVTVVTTTTWTIHWKDDSPLSKSEVDPAADDVSTPAQMTPTLLPAQEADVEITETNSPSADEPPTKSHSIKNRKEIKP